MTKLDTQLPGYQVTQLHTEPPGMGTLRPLEEAGITGRLYEKNTNDLGLEC